MRNGECNQNRDTHLRKQNAETAFEHAGGRSQGHLGADREQIHRKDSWISLISQRLGKAADF
jgi:hypothetical protein